MTGCSRTWPRSSATLGWPSPRGRPSRHYPCTPYPATCGHPRQPNRRASNQPAPVSPALVPSVSIDGAGASATAGELVRTGDPRGDQDGAQASHAQESRPVTYDDASRLYGPGTIGARERYDELSMRDHLARAYASLGASGEYDAARHGTGDTAPLTAAEHLDLLATAESVRRVSQAGVRGRHRAAWRGTGRRSRRPGRCRGDGPRGVSGMG